VEFTPLSFIPHAAISQYLGRVCITLIQELYSYESKGGLGAFVETFLLEVNQVARTHVRSRGGNALIGYCINEMWSDVTDSQAYTIISISGDAVKCVKQ
jgi:hypothetical protein